MDQLNTTQTLKTILFSAMFGTDGMLQRLNFLERVQQAFPEPVRFVAFNISGEANAGLEVVNAMGRYKPQVGDSLEYLQNLLEHLFADKARRLIDHIKGEFSKNPKAYRANAYKVIRMILEFKQTLELYKPDYVYLWNQFNAFHRILAELLKQRGIRHGFFHDGVLPGSIAFDVDGEMGGSWIARDPQKFMGVHVSSEDIKRANWFLEKLESRDISRYSQTDHISIPEALRNSGLNDRPVVFLAGQNDWHSGIKPRSRERLMHSHIFPGSAEALVAIDKVAGDIGVTILFKPHPGTKDKHTFLRQESLSNSLILSSVSMQSCLKAADLVATIASQTCYVALITGKPVMMLGKNQISGKGLTYDAAFEEEIAVLIKEGIEDPLKSNRRQMLARHVAQLERAYLFNYQTIDIDYYRRGPAEAGRYMQACIELSVEEVIQKQIAGELD